MNQQEGLTRAIEMGLFSIENMKYYKMYKPIARLKDISWNDKAVLIAVLSFIKNDQLFTMSNETLSHELGIHRATVIRAINNLKNKKIIKTLKKLKKSDNSIIGRIISIDESTIKQLINAYDNEYYYVEY